jgi:GDP-L-fucose synthase
MHSNRILITGATGLVGTALIEELQNQGYAALFPLDRTQCDLINFIDTKNYFSHIKPDIVFHLAASVYGIGGNLQSPASIFLNNTLMNTHVIEASRLAGAKKIIAMGTIAAYPEPKIIPIKEEQIWDGAPHASEASYGHAKRAMLAQLMAYKQNYGLDFSYIISTNLYGKHDRFDKETGHVVPSLIKKFYDAKHEGTPVTIWGDGTACRDFLYSKDMGRALILIMERFSGPINAASGKKTEIKEVAAHLARYFEIDEMIWDANKPNGRAFHPSDLTHLNSLGFTPRYSLEEGLQETLDWFTYEKNCYCQHP